MHKVFLETHAEGLQHLGFLISGYDEMSGRFVKAGFQPLERAETYLENYKGYLRACYFDAHKVRRRMRDLLEVVASGVLTDARL